MGATKYPVLSESFYVDMFAHAIGPEQQALIFILSETGLHPSSLRSLKMKRERTKSLLEWRRPKTNLMLEVEIKRRDRLDLVRSFLSGRLKTPQHYNSVLKTIGQRAGYDGVSFMTFRHTYCIRLLTEGFLIWEVPHIMGTTLDVTARNYSYVKRRDVDLSKFRYKTLQ